MNPCTTCGWPADDHDLPVPDDWYVDPGAYPCDDYSTE